MRQIDLPQMIRLFRENKKTILLRALALSFVILFLLLFRQPQFTSQALFQDVTPTLKMQSSLAPLLRGLDRGQEEGHAMLRMKTDRVLSKVVTELGLQVKKRELRLAERPLKNFRAELQLPVEMEASHFSRVRYDGEESLKFSLQFIGKNRFAIKNCMGITLGLGILGEPVDLGSFAFTLLATPRKKEQYFLIQPKWKAIKKLKRKIRIRKNRDDPAMIKLFCTYPNRHLAQQVVQKIVYCYQSELKAEKKDVAMQQLVHLEKRLHGLKEDYRQQQKAHLQQSEKRSYEEQRALQEKAIDSVFLAQVEGALSELLEQHAEKRGIEGEMLLNQKMQKMLLEMIEDRQVEATVRPLRSQLIDPATLPFLPDRPLLFPVFVLSVLLLSFFQLLWFSNRTAFQSQKR